MQTSLLQSNALKIPLADKKVHCVITSPPYYGLRDYSAPGQLGLEPTLQEYIDNTVLWCREVWRVLRGDGTFWLNLGDSYVGSANSGGPSKVQDGADNRGRLTGMPTKQGKPKDLMLVPHRVAIALQNDGWWVRSDIVWHKPNPMPESVTDRPTKSHEYIFLLTKSGESLFWTHPEKQGTRTKPEPDYLYTHKETDEETREMPPGDWKQNWKRKNLWSGHDYYYDQDVIREPHQDPADIHRRIKKDGEYKHGKSQRGWMDGSEERADLAVSRGRNKRSVWTITTKPYKGAHFATFPPEIPEICIKAGTSEKGVCPVCGSQWARVTDKQPTGKIQKMADGWDARKGSHSTIHRSGRSKGQSGIPVTENVTLGWKPACSHNEEPIPAIVCDPFGGSGTTAAVAKSLGRVGICMDLSWEYLQLAKERCGKVEYQYSF